MSTPYTPQQNRAAEREIHTIVEMARNMLHAQDLDKSFWTKIVVHTQNQWLTRALAFNTHVDAWSGRRPCIAHMRVFECITYAMVPDEKKDKLDAKDTKCLFLVYYEETKVYRLMYLQTEHSIEIKDMVSMKDSTNVWNNLEMCPYGKIEGHMAVVVDECSKSSSCEMVRTGMQGENGISLYCK